MYLDSWMWSAFSKFRRLQMSEIFTYLPLFFVRAKGLVNKFTTFIAFRLQRQHSIQLDLSERSPFISHSHTGKVESLEPAGYLPPHRIVDCKSA